MNEEKARYIVLMLSTFPDGFFWRESTDVDYAERQRISDRYGELRGLMLFSDAMLIAKSEFILRVASEGVPAGAGLPPMPKPDTGATGAWDWTRGMEAKRPRRRGGNTIR